MVLRCAEKADALCRTESNGIGEELTEARGAADLSMMSIHDKVHIKELGRVQCLIRRY